MIGVHPDAYTLRQLIIMAEHRQRMDWGRFASLMAVVATFSQTFAEKREIFYPSQFNPFTKIDGGGDQSDESKGQVIESPIGINALKVFVNNPPGK